MLRKLAVLLSSLAMPVMAETVEVQTYRGPEEVQQAPEKIAVFDVAALDTLAALNVEIDGVISKVYVDYLDDAVSDASHIGTLFEPDYEAIAAMAPDLIVAGGRSYEVVPDLAKIAPTIDMTIDKDVIGEGLRNLQAFGKIFGKEAEATKLTTDFNAKLASTRELLSDKGSALIVMTNGPKISAYGSGGRFGWLHTALEVPEAIENVEATTHGEAVSFEFIRDANPDILIVVDRLAAIGRDGERAQSTLDNELVHDTKAWKNNQVVYLNSAPLYIAGGGIQAMNILLDQIQSTFSGS